MICGSPQNGVKVQYLNGCIVVLTFSVNRGTLVTIRFSTFYELRPLPLWISEAGHKATQFNGLIIRWSAANNALAADR